MNGILIIMNGEMQVVALIMQDRLIRSHPKSDVFHQSPEKVSVKQYDEDCGGPGNVVFSYDYTVAN